MKYMYYSPFSLVLLHVLHAVVAELYYEAVVTSLYCFAVVTDLDRGTVNEFMHIVLGCEARVIRDHKNSFQEFATAFLLQGGLSHVVFQFVTYSVDVFTYCIDSQ